MYLWTQWFLGFDCSSNKIIVNVKKSSLILLGIVESNTIKAFNHFLAFVHWFQNKLLTCCVFFAFGLNLVWCTFCFFRFLFRCFFSSLLCWVIPNTIIHHYIIYLLFFDCCSVCRLQPMHNQFGNEFNTENTTLHMASK